MKYLMFQSDDYGFTQGVAEGIIRGIKEGIVRNTGLFVNMPSSAKAAQMIKEIEHVAVGIDINLVAGRPVSDPKDVPSLVDQNGHFISSVQRKKEGKIIKNDGVNVIFEEDPYNFEETLLETENQLLRFIELMGRKPDYFHAHSLMTPNTSKAAQMVAKKYDIPLSFCALEDPNVVMVPCTWTPKPFPMEDQMNTDVEHNFIESLKKCLDKDGEVGYFICHCGYVDADLLDETTYTMIRTRDLQCALSLKVKQFLDDNGIQLISFKDYMEAK